MFREAFAGCSRMREQYVEKKRRADEGGEEEGSRRIARRWRMESETGEVENTWRGRKRVPRGSEVVQRTLRET